MSERRAKAKRIFTILEEQNPRPVTELNFETPWQLLVATVLSAQSTDKQVNKVTSLLFVKYPHPAQLAALMPEELAAEIKSIGLFRTKSKHLVASAKALLERHGGEVPADLPSLLALPGVGQKTANVILANAFGIPALAVDTHVFRVANRLGLVKAKTPTATEQQLTSLIARELWTDAHHWLILHGRYICHARNPHCTHCSLSEHCDYFHRQENRKGR
ncbi:MAG: endonuclease III [Firmicutes bacterium]|jgi:endonuclease-3|nr:endonuclease III [Dethiobacter sp.]MCL4462489.1 endonuclease III [Bacillota bacterium]MCL5993730.1 endonuclease III [Bacillota bacterium]